MKIKISLIGTILVIISFFTCYSQSNNIKLADTIHLTYKDVLDLRLQILAAQITSGCYTIEDMGGIAFPVSIRINNKNKIEFKTEGSFENKITKEQQKEIMSEGFLFVRVGITELIERHFSKINFNKNDIVGYWYLKGAHDPCAKWEHDKFEWLKL